MKNKHKKILILFLFLLVCFIIFQPTAVADVGGNVDYDYHGGSSDSDSSWDSNWDSDWDSDWNSGGSSDNFVDPLLVYFLIDTIGIPGTVVLVIVAFIFTRKRKPTFRSKPRREDKPSSNNYNTYLNKKASLGKREENLDLLKQKDPNFSENAFIARINNMFVELQKAWSEKDWKRARPYEHDQIFRMHHRQLQEFIDKERTNVVEDISIVESYIESYEEDNSFEYIDAIIQAKFRDFVLDDKTQAVIKGNPSHRYLMTYRWKLMRRLGAQTEIRDLEVTQCPNCGANLSINQGGTCDYCGSEITSGNYDWVLTSIETLDQTLI